MEISSEMAKKAKCFADFSVLCILIPRNKIAYGNFMGFCIVILR